MKYSLALAALVAAVTAQDLSTIPECAHSCITDAMGGAGCGTDDYQCACANMESLVTDAAPCVLGACESAADVLSAVNEFCAGLSDSDGETTTAEPPATTDAEEPTEPTETTAAPEPTATDDTEEDDDTEDDGEDEPTDSGSVVPPEPTQTEEPEPTDSEDEDPPTETAAAAGLGKIGGLGMLALGALAAF